MLHFRDLCVDEFFLTWLGGEVLRHAVVITEYGVFFEREQLCTWVSILILDTGWSLANFKAGRSSVAPSSLRK